MKPPSTTARRLILASVAVGAGAAGGAVAGAQDRSVMRPVSTLGGAMVGSIGVGFVGIVTALLSPKWRDAGLVTAAVGVGLPLGLGIATAIARGALGPGEKEAPPPALGQEASPVALTLMPGGGGQAGSQSATVKAGGSLVLSLPTGATWVSLQDSGGGSAKVSGSVAATVVVGAAETLTAAWTDASGTRQTTSIAVTVY